MPKYIVKLDGRYMVWSTITDKPATALLTLEDIKEILRKEAEEEFELEFASRIKRVELKGHSCIDLSSLDPILNDNRAGDDETELTVDEIIKKYWWDYENEENNTMFMDKNDT